MHRLAAFRVGNAYCRSHHHRRVRSEAGFDLVGVDIAIVADDGVLDPVQHVEKSIFVDATVVARFPEAVTEFLRGFFRGVQVARDDRPGTHPDLAVHTGGDRFAIPAHDQQLRPRRNPSSGGDVRFTAVSERQVIRFAQCAHDADMLRTAVKLYENIAEALPQFLQLGGTHGGGTIIDGVQG